MTQEVEEKEKRKRTVSLRFSNQHWMCKGSGQPGRHPSQIRVISEEDPSSWLLRLVSGKISQYMLYLCQPFFQWLHWQNRQLIAGVNRKDSKKPPTPGRSIRDCLQVSSRPGIDPKCWRIWLHNLAGVRPGCPLPLHIQCWFEKCKETVRFLFSFSSTSWVMWFCTRIPSTRI